MKINNITKVACLLIIVLILMHSTIQISTGDNDYNFGEKNVSITSEVGIYYDVPMSKEMQDFTRNQSEYNGVPFELTLAVIEQESMFNPNIISETGDYGYMQINESNHDYIEKMYGITDFINAKNNIIAGTMLLGTLYNMYEDVNMAIMVYNMGGEKAISYWNNGIYETDYTREVVKKFETYRNSIPNS